MRAYRQREAAGKVRAQKAKKIAERARILPRNRTGASNAKKLPPTVPCSRGQISPCARAKSPRLFAIFALCRPEILVTGSPDRNKRTAGKVPPSPLSLSLPMSHLSLVCRRPDPEIALQRECTSRAHSADPSLWLFLSFWQHVCCLVGSSYLFARRDTPPRPPP